MNRRRTCLFAALLAIAFVAAGADAPRPLADKLKSLAGSGAEDCGTVLLHDAPDAAFACAESAAASGKAYRLALEFEGPDGAGWQGATRDAQGKLWTLYFDTDPSAPAGAGATLSVVPCSEIRFDSKGDDVIRCKPILGRQR